jgi:hypothetical protein
VFAVRLLSAPVPASWNALSLLKVAHLWYIGSVASGALTHFSDGVSPQPGTLGYLVQREHIAEKNPVDFSQHFHADYPVFSCSESEQKQLNIQKNPR